MLSRGERAGAGGRTRDRFGRRGQEGFTLLEMSVVVLILATLTSIGIALYLSSLNSARIAKCKEELRIVAHAVDSYRANNHGTLPEDLDLVGHGNRLDPWGHPYMYLNFATGTGSGMEFVMANGLVDPAAHARIQASFDALPPSKKGKKSAKKLLDPITFDLGSKATEIDAVKRKDRFLFPLNTDYDLFSLGPNGKAFASIVQNYSLDDVIRANDGAWYGSASDY